MDLTRYKLSVTATQYMGVSVLRQNSKGEWVKYDDAVKEIAKLESIIKSQNNDMAELNNRLASSADRSAKACSEIAKIDPNSSLHDILLRDLSDAGIYAIRASPYYVKFKRVV